ncbi:MAG: YfhO family protein [Ilumatobacteraceae bacterium]
MDIDRELDAPRPTARATVLRWWALSLVVVTLPFTQLLLGTRTAVQGDNADYHVSLYVWIWRRISDGLTPFWGGFDFAGQNVAGAGQGAIWYPPNVLFAWSDTVAAFRWWTMLHVWCAATGAFVWSWHKWGSRAGAAVSAVAFGLNGVFLLHFVHTSFTAATAWMPWLFLGLDRLLERGGARRFAAMAAPLAMIGLTGHPQMLWAALIGVAVVTVVELTASGRGLAPWGRMAAASAAGVAIAAVQLVPQYLFSRTSERPDLGTEKALRTAATTTDLLTSMFPWYKGGASGLPLVSKDWLGTSTYHEVGNHLGLAAVVLAWVGAVVWWRRRRVQALMALGLLGIVLAMAGATPLGRVIFDALPLADRFRIWPRYLVLANLAAACLAGLGTRLVLELPRARRRAVLLCGIGAGAGAVLLRVVTDVGGQLASGWALWLGIAIPVASVVAVAWSMGDHVSRRVRGLTVVGAVAVPAVLFALGAPWRNEGMSPAAATAFFSAAAPPFPFLDAPGGVDRWGTQLVVLRGVQTVTDTARVNSYDPLIQADFATVTGAADVGGFLDDRVWSPPGLIADLLRITTIYGGPDLAPTDSSWTFVSPPGDPANSAWQRAPRLPEAYVVGQVVADTLDGITARLQDDATDLTGTVYLDDRAAASGTFAGRTIPGGTGTVDGSLSNDGTADFTITAERAGVLVVSTAWLDGWTATVDGRAAPVARANGLVLAVPVPEGTSTVHLEFSAPGVRVAGFVSLLAILALAGWLVLPSLRRRLRWG